MPHREAYMILWWLFGWQSRQSKRLSCNVTMFQHPFAILTLYRNLSCSNTHHLLTPFCFGLFLCCHISRTPYQTHSCMHTVPKPSFTSPPVGKQQILVLIRLNAALGEVLETPSQSADGDNCSSSDSHKQWSAML